MLKSDTFRNSAKRFESRKTGDGIIGSGFARKVGFAIIFIAIIIIMRD